jgi:hypothetical protein
MHKQINQLRASLMAQFPERKDVIDGSLAAVLAGEHVLMIGPPGTAKSALVRCLAQVFGGSYFERLLTKFSTPEELFGPISLQGLAQDRFVRLTAGKLPEAEFAFVDEIFKSNSAVLNALLSVINERVFHNDGAPVRCRWCRCSPPATSCPKAGTRGAIRPLPASVRRRLPAGRREPARCPGRARAGDRGDAHDGRAAPRAGRGRRGQGYRRHGRRAAGDPRRVPRRGDHGVGPALEEVARVVRASAWLAGEKKTCPEDLAILISIAQAAQAVEQFDAQQAKLQELAKSGGRRAKVVIGGCRDPGPRGVDFR